MIKFYDDVSTSGQIKEGGKSLSEKYASLDTDGKVLETQLRDPLPSQAGHEGHQLFSDGVNTYWKAPTVPRVEIQRTDVIVPANSPVGFEIGVPAHTVGSTALSVYINGLMVTEGASAQYIDATETSITLNDSYPMDSVVTVSYVTNKEITRTVTTLATDVPSNHIVTTAQHIVGSSTFEVYIDGVLALPGADKQFIDYTPTSIMLNDPYEAGTVVTCIAY